jgi:AmmeMemoRadiSam system protein B
MMAQIRRPAVAGSFYPADPGRLRAMVSGFLAETSTATHDAKAVIAPHAGYMYSGAVAGRAFSCISERAHPVARVVLIGPSHFVPFRGIAVPEARAFETPLGRVPVDDQSMASLSDLPFVLGSDAAHCSDHAIEVQLPFLQMRLPGFLLLPLLVGEARPSDVAEALRLVWGGTESIIVVSSDLSHFHGCNTARRLDASTAEKIESGDWAGLGPDNACGYLSIAGLMIEAKRRGLKAQRLALCNSGDTAGPRDQVVGYGAWAFSESAASASEVLSVCRECPSLEDGE